MNIEVSPTELNDIVEALWLLRTERQRQVMKYKTLVAEKRLNDTSELYDRLSDHLFEYAKQDATIIWESLSKQ